MDQGTINQPSRTVLVIEDSQSQALALESLFESKNLAVLKASTGLDGFILARTHQPDLILLDIYLPDMTGLEVCYILKRDPKTSHIPIVLLTSKPSQDLREEGLETAGAVEFIPKDPFTPAVLLKLLHRMNIITE